MGELLLEAKKGVLETDFHLRVEVVSYSGVGLVLLLFQGEDDIAGFEIRALFSLSVVNDSVSVFGACLDFHLKFLGSLSNLLSAANRAFLGVCGTLSAAFWAVGLHLDLHAYAHLYILHHYSRSTTLLAYLLLPILGPCAPTGCAYLIPLNIETMVLTPMVQVF